MEIYSLLRSLLAGDGSVTSSGETCAEGHDDCQDDDCVYCCDDYCYS
jgi:hypothetical protein